MKLYQSAYCSCVHKPAFSPISTNLSKHEPAFSPISTHLSKAGAYKAMRNHMVNEFNEWRNGEILYGKDRLGGNDRMKNQAWKIFEIEVLE